MLNVLFQTSGCLVSNYHLPSQWRKYTISTFDGISKITSIICACMQCSDCNVVLLYAPLYNYCAILSYWLSIFCVFFDKFAPFLAFFYCLFTCSHTSSPSLFLSSILSFFLLSFFLPFSILPSPFNLTCLLFSSHIPLVSRQRVLHCNCIHRIQRVFAVETENIISLLFPYMKSRRRAKSQKYIIIIWCSRWNPSRFWTCHSNCTFSRQVKISPYIPCQWLIFFFNSQYSSFVLFLFKGHKIITCKVV